MRWPWNRSETQTKLNTVKMHFVNSNSELVYIQVDPWASVFELGKGDEVEILAETENPCAEFWLEEYDDTRIFTVYHSSDFYVIRDGKRLHWTDV